ncbi:unnamed protein product [Scytosiphon promiscuus]
MSRIMSRALTLAVISAAAHEARAVSSRGVARTFFGSRRSTAGSSDASGHPAFIAAVGGPAAALDARRGANSATASAAAISSAAPVVSRVHGAFGAKASPALSTRGGSGVAMMSTSGTATPVPHLSVHDMSYTPESTAQVSASAIDKAETWEGDVLVLLAYQQEDKEAFAGLAGAGAAAADNRLEGVVADMIASQEFKGEKKGSVSAVLGSKAGVKRVAVLGLGKEEDASLKASALEAIGSQLAELAKSSKCKSMGIVLPEGCAEGSTAALAQGALIGLYADKRYKTGDGDKKPLPLQSIEIIGGEESASFDGAKAVASGVSFCRDLVNSPPNMLTPTSLAEAAKMMSEEHGLECEILEEDEIVARGMGAYMGVAQGAVFPPKFIHLTYKPSGTPKKKVALIGKGLTFDSGGYNIKAGAGSLIELMKFDMGGSACTLGAAKAIAQLKPEGVEAHFIVAACENMVSEKAMRPGDILTASNGKTIEVINTDAEGRLTLADALVFAEKLEVDAIIDSATLTGAIMIALGGDYAGMWSSDEGLAKEITDAGAETGEKLWRMPLVPEYGEEIKSKVADLKNVGGRYGSSITAALFLKEFVKKTPWAHIDIAGPVWNMGEGGATGYGVKLLTRWVQKKGE